MDRRWRFVLIAALVLAVVASVGGRYAWSSRDSQNTAGSAKGSGGPGLVDRLNRAARDLVGGGKSRQKAEPVSAGLAVSEPAVKGVKWPAQKRVREVTGKRTANGRVYQLSDGRLQAEISQVPVNYRDRKGRWQPIDTRVRPTSRAGFVQGNTTNTFTSLFGASSDRLLRFEKDGAAVELGLAGAPRKAAPRVSGSTVTYPGLAGGADLVYEVTPTEAKEKILLHRAPQGAASFTFTVDTKGLVAPQQQPDGSITFAKASGERPVLTMPAPFMSDSAATEATSTKVTQRVAQHGGRTTVTVTADPAWLADPARVYPVVVDPTVKVQPIPTEAKDVEIYSTQTVNKADTYQLKVGTDATAAWRSMLQFDLSTIPAGTTIDDAQLQLYYDQSFSTSSYDVPMEARRITQPWEELTATWANSSANIAAGAAGNVVTKDDGDAGTSVVGTWPYSTSTLIAKGINGDYRYHGSTLATDSHTWVPTITESGDYLVEVHYVGASDRPASAPYTVFYNGGSTKYTVDQTTPANDGAWVPLGVHTFAAGTTGKVVLNGVPGTAANADAVRFTKSGSVKRADKSSRWLSFPVRDLAQGWVSGTQPNYGVMVKAINETDKGRGGAVFEASEYAYQNDRRDFNLPRLVVTYGRPGVTVNPPTTITSTGAVLTWPAYVDPSTTTTADDIVEYQIHRSTKQVWTPSAATLVAPVSSSTLTFQDTTATPTPAAETDPMKRKFFYYMVAVKTKDGQVIPGPTVPAMLPKAGQITRIYRTGVTDTTLSGTLKTTNLDVYDGDPYVAVGNNSPTYGDTRGLVKFGSLTGISTDAQVVGAELRMWNTYLYPGTDTNEYVDVYPLTRAFTEAKATWNSYDGVSAWTTPGGDYSTPATSGFNGFTNDPEWETWDVTSPVKGWLTTPTSNYGLLLKQRDEVNATARAMLLSSEAAEPLLRPTLEVTYLEQTPESTYYAPQTPTNVSPSSTYTTPVSVSNPTLAAWNATDWELGYKWTRADGTTPVTDAVALQGATPLPANIAAGGTVDLTATVKTPASTDEGNKRTDYVLKWELRNKLTGKWLSDTAPIAGLPQNVAVAEPTSDQLGLEKFYSYAGKNTGAGGTLMNNLYAGNTVWSYNAFTNPSRGLATFVRMAYNSLDTTDTVAGYGWSLQASSMMRLGSPLDFHPNPNPTKVTLVDGDGTSHWFTWDATTAQWVSPKGIHLYLQQKPGIDCQPNTQEPQAWSLTRPDRTQFFYDCDGFLTSTVDKNGGTLTFTYEERKSNNKPTKFLRYLTDPEGRQTLTVDYYAKGDSYDYIDDTTWTRTSATNLTNPKIIDHVKQITDISGRKLIFTYTDKGLLGELVDGAGSTNGTPKTFRFAYDMTQGNKNVKLVKVTDPRGHATTLTYNYPQTGDDPQLHWRTKSYTDRLGNPTQFGYTDPDGPQGTTMDATVTDAENHTTSYRMDGYGRPYQSTNAKNQTTTLGWDDQHNVNRLTEPNGAVSTWTYDPKTGYPTEIKDAEAVKNGTPGTVLTYQTQLGGYVADLTTKTSPEGRQWRFGYTLEGDLETVTDPLGTSTPTAGDYTTTNTYDTWGRLQTSKDANGNTTTYSNYDPTGYPKTITDALNNATAFVYDDRGQVTEVTDALGKKTTQAYDTFGRPLENKVPKDQAAGVYITTPAPVYDTNDNVTQSTAPNGAVTTAVYDDADQLTATNAPVDVTGDPERKASYTYDKVGNLITTTEPKGNLTPTDPADFVTTNTYDEIYQLTSVTNAEGQKISYVYNNVGDVITVIDPRKNATADPADYTQKFVYDWVHRQTTATDATNYKTSTEYDRDGNVTATIDQGGNKTLLTYDARAKLVEQKEPVSKDAAGVITYRTTQFEYDQVGNQTKVISPRGTVTTDPDDFATVTVYDELNRVKETWSAYDKNDARYNTPDKTTYTYDRVGRLATLSAPPSSGQSVRNDSTYSYYDNGWTKTSADPWDILTTYNYNELGGQTARTVTSAGGSSNRTMSWSYFPDGKLKARSDDGVPVGKQVVLVDNSDFNNRSFTGTWPTADTATGKYGTDYVTHAAGTGSNTFTWKLNIPQSGSYEVFARYPQVTGAATDAKYTINYDGGTAVKTVNQAASTGTWVSLGSYNLAEGNTQKITLTDQATGTVIADAVKLVRDNTTDADNEKQDFQYQYDANGNLTAITDASPGARVDSYDVKYTGLNQVDKVIETKAGAAANTTSFAYNENGEPTSVSHDRQYSSYTYDVRDLVSQVKVGTSATDPSPKTTGYTYTARFQPLTETKPNGNQVSYGYGLDKSLTYQVEKKPSGTVVAEHSMSYDLNGNLVRDVNKKMRADNHAAYIFNTTTNTYDPRDRIATVTRAGDTPGTETYIHDANNNVISQTVKSTTTAFNYDRNRLLTAVSGTSTSSYNYDPFGRLDTVTAGDTVLERNVYDGFDHIVENRKTQGGTTATTKYTFDPLDRTTSKTTNAGTSSAKITDFSYLGLSSEVLDEEVAGKLTKSYQYSPWGERLSQVTYKDDGTTEDAYYGYNAHTDVEILTDSTGDTKATYGYTAYGSNDEAQFTGIDKPDPADPTKEAYNPYRFNAKRWDQASGSYDMGFRDYSPGLNRFLTRDSYNGALSDMNLGLDSWTGNRYAFAGGNPISMIENDGHEPCVTPGDCDYGYTGEHSQSSTPPTTLCSKGPADMPSCGASSPKAGIFLGPNLVTAPSEQELTEAIQAQMDRWCNHSGTWEKVLGGAGVDGCAGQGASELVENEVRSHICNDHPDWCNLQDVSDVNLIQGVAGVGYAAFGKSGGRPPHTATMSVFDSSGNEIFTINLKSGNMTEDERARGFPQNSLATHTERRAMLQPIPQDGQFIVLEGQYSPCPTCRRAMRETAETRNVVVTYRWQGRVWMATPEASGYRYRKLISRLTRAR